MPNFELPLVVTTDASLVSVGAILEQDFGNGMQPVAFDSRKLNPAETRYSAYERELLGIIWAIGKWRHYLEGRSFIVQTDHSSLKHLPNQPSVSRRIWNGLASYRDTMWTFDIFLVRSTQTLDVTRCHARRYLEEPTGPSCEDILWSL